jgi:uncharacterized membrane protein YdbT with pleckstrin-like domain
VHHDPPTFPPVRPAAPAAQIEECRHNPAADGYTDRMALILWILAVLLVVYGIYMIFRGQVLLGIVVIIVGLLVGPGGVSVFT